jgi:hypothetical protein
MTTKRQMFLLSHALGALIALIPLILKLRRDPFDADCSYAVWWIGFFVASTIMGFREPDCAKKVAQELGSDFRLRSRHIFSARQNLPNLWALSLMVGEKKVSGTISNGHGDSS